MTSCGSLLLSGKEFVKRFRSNSAIPMLASACPGKHLTNLITAALHLMIGLQVPIVVAKIMCGYPVKGLPLKYVIPFKLMWCRWWSNWDTLLVSMARYMYFQVRISLRILSKGWGDKFMLQCSP